MKKLYRHALGWFFLFLGVIGLFLPVLQGILFLFVGVIILAPEVPFFQRMLDKMEKRHPALFAQAKCLFERVSARLRGKKKHCPGNSQYHKIKES